MGLPDVQRRSGGRSFQGHGGGVGPALAPPCPGSRGAAAVSRQQPFAGAWQPQAGGLHPGPRRAELGGQMEDEEEEITASALRGKPRPLPVSALSAFSYVPPRRQDPKEHSYYYRQGRVSRRGLGGWRLLLEGRAGGLDAGAGWESRAGLHGG